MKDSSIFLKDIKKVGRLDTLVLAPLLLLATFGTVMVFTSGYAYAEARYSDPYYFIKRQLLWMGAGIIIMILSSRLDTRKLKRYSLHAYLLTLALLVLTLAIGFVGNGAQRWISIGPLTVQPSEIAKLTMVLMLAGYFDSYEKKAVLSENRSTSFLYGTLIPSLIIFIPIFLVIVN